MKDYKNPIKATMNKAKDNLLDIADAIYQQGYEARKAEESKSARVIVNTEQQKSYEDGLNDAWQVARKLVHRINGGYTNDEKKIIFNSLTSNSILLNYTAPEAIAKIKAYEDKQKQDAEIKVGDEVYRDDEIRGIVINIIQPHNFRDTVGYEILWCKDGTSIDSMETLHKTGRHFPQIAEVLAELRGKRCR